MQLPLSDFNPTEIAEQLGLKVYQGQQVFRWLHQKRVFDIDAMTNLSKDLRRRLSEECLPAQLKLLHMSDSRSGTRKALFALFDGETVESVLLPDRDRITLCLSTQVGCPVRCAFCATGLSGFTRNLSAGEIVEQALHLLADVNIEDRTPNIVYMGMGEPFRNYDAVVRSIRLLMRKDGLNIGARKITVSTVGEVPGIQRFAQEKWQVRLSLSLHAANDELRSRLVPLNKKYPLGEVMKAIHGYVETAGRHITFEWVLLNGVNDTAKDAGELVRLVRPFKAKASVNLIPYNAVEDTKFAAPSRGKCEAFRDALVRQGVTCTLRTERGGDIDAACGQLRRRQGGI